MIYTAFANARPSSLLLCPPTKAAVVPSTTSTETAGKTHIYDEAGDLTLEMGEARISCLVSSGAMAEASCVFRGMLFGGFSESRPSEGEWVVQLPEDGIEGFDIILKIIHGRWQEVPITFEELETHEFADHEWQKLLRLAYKVARVADKYDVTYLLQPLSDSWRRALTGGLMYPGLSDGSCSAALWIGWVFGDRKLVDDQLPLVYLFAYGDEEGSLNYENVDEDGALEHDGAVLVCEQPTEYLLPLWNSRLCGYTSMEDAHHILNLLDVSGMST